MDRVIVYPGSLPQDTDVLSAYKDSMIAIGAVWEAIVGQQSVAVGFTCTALANTVVPGSAFAVQLSRGFLTSYQEVDATAYGSLGADASRNIMKCGINLSSTNIGLTNSAPSSGQSINYLVSAGFSETDGTPIVLPYYNASNPSSPYAGPGNDGVAQNTVRAQTVVFQVTAGSAASTGSQTTPAAPSGYYPLFVVTVTNGQTAVAGGNISQSPLAPILPWNLRSKNPGLQGYVVQLTNSSFTVPAGITQMKITAIGGGGGGGSAAVTGSSTYAAGAGGNAGGSAVVFLTALVPGTVINWTIGAGGAGSTNSVSGTMGGTTSVYQSGTLIAQATGGGGGTSGSAQAAPSMTSPQILIGYGAVGTVQNYGGQGSPGFAISNTVDNLCGGGGGASILGAGAPSTTYANAGNYASTYGSGGGGACANANNVALLAGGAGAQGCVIIEY